MKALMNHMNLINRRCGSELLNDELLLSEVHAIDSASSQNDS